MADNGEDRVHEKIRAPTGQGNHKRCAASLAGPLIQDAPQLAVEKEAGEFA
jgi:hypothetical protein